MCGHVTSRMKDGVREIPFHHVLHQIYLTYHLDIALKVQNDGGTTTGQHRTNTGQHRTNTGPTLDQHRTNTGPTPDQHRTMTGP